ncbi:MAG: S24 family peptidase [Sphingobium sp.]
MTGQEKNERSRVVGWSPAAAARLKAAVKRYGSQGHVAELSQISRQSLVDILGGRAVPTVGTLARLCDVLALTDSEILGDARGPSDAAPDLDAMAFVPLHDVVVSAGSGAMAMEAGQSAESLGFPTAWLRGRFGDPSKLRIVHVKGDSMAPALGDGDMVMINLGRRDPIDGVFVLRLHEQLMVKRVHFPSARRVLVTSDNRDYDRFDRMIDLEKGEDFELIGRAVWVGKAI